MCGGGGGGEGREVGHKLHTGQVSLYCHAWIRHEDYKTIICFIHFLFYCDVLQSLFKFPVFLILLLL